MSQTGITLSRRGLELDAPSSGDVVTVLIRPPKDATKAPAGIARPSHLGIVDLPAHENPHHYRINALWRVSAVNGGQAVVQRLTGHGAYKARREVWSIALHRWFEAGELWEALREDQERQDEEDATRDLEMADMLRRVKEIP